jgi:hypothetical protein
MSTETRLFTGLVLFVGIIVVSVVGYDIYMHPPDPETVGTAIIEITGEGAFRGSLGTIRDEHAIHATAPVTLSVDFRRADYVFADVGDSQDIEATIGVKRNETIEIVEKGTGIVMWKVPPHRWN